MRDLLIVLFAILALGSCKKPSEAPQFKKVSGIRVAKMDGNIAHLNADAHFHNPNGVKMKLRQVDVNVTLDGKKIGKIKQTLKTIIPANSDFKVPVNATFDVKESGVLNNVLRLLGGKRMKVNYTGFVKLTVYGVPVRVPVDYTSELKL